MTETKSAEVEHSAEKGMEHSEHKIPSSLHLITGVKETGHSWTTHTARRQYSPV